MHTSAVIGGEGVRAEGPAQTWRAGGQARALQNTHIYDEKYIFDVFSREVSQNRQAGRRAVLARILEGEKAYRTQWKSRMFMFSTSQTQRYFQF